MQKFDEEVIIKTATVKLFGNLVLPKETTGLVIFAHGSGSSRFSKRNQFVAKVFQDEGLGTLLMDLLTHEEEEADLITRHIRFDIPLLADRMVGATTWIKEQAMTKSLNVGYIGSSTGAAAALVAAAKQPKWVKAVVSRGGRPDLAGEYLARVLAPTLLIVGGNDFAVIDMNREAYQLMSCEKRLEIVPNATHLFEEPGTLEEASRLACLWFKSYL